jgi:hypothetical protein
VSHARRAFQLISAGLGKDGDMAIADVWTQHPAQRFLAQEMFGSLRRGLFLGGNAGRLFPADA